MPDYDIYVLSSLRNKSSVSNFINKYTDRALLENRADEELMILPLGITNEDNLDSDDYDWIPAISISNVIDIGLKKPFRGFRFYLNSNQRDIRNVIIAFTIDGYIIYGISVDGEMKDIDFAKKILINLFNEYQGIHGGIFIEEPAPLSSRRFSHMLYQSKIRI